MNRIKVLEIFMHERKVGTMALFQDRAAAFEYDEGWLKKGFAISPYSLPLEKKVYIPKWDPFGGLYGVFADSLPDGWGRLLVDRILLREGMNPNEVDNINRLAIVGASGMGALTYVPVHEFQRGQDHEDLDKLAVECKNMLKTDYSDNLDELFSLGGSSGGARPKILTKYNEEEWIIKFPSSYDKDDIGEEEYRYSLCAKACKIEMAETKLFESKRCPGYFGTKRFDREKDENGNEQRIHMLSVGAILETSHRIPNLDYNILMKLTLELTKDYKEVEKLYRLMCFNVFAHNRDDHSKNFSFILDEKQQSWHLAPAYDLTYSNSIGGEHATTVNGNGRDPGMKEILHVAEAIGLGSGEAKRIAEEIYDTVTDMLPMTR